MSRCKNVDVLCFNWYYPVNAHLIAMCIFIILNMSISTYVSLSLYIYIYIHVCFHMYLLATDPLEGLYGRPRYPPAQAHAVDHNSRLARFLEAD